MATAPRQRPEERRLLEWCRLQGVVLDGVKLDGRRLVATRDLAVGHCAISVPKAAVLSTDQAMASDIGQRILAQPGLLVVQDLERQRRLWLAGARHLDLAQGAVTRRSVLYAFLIHLRGSGGSWGAYADALPKSYGSPFTWATRELGAELRDEVSKWREHLDGQYAALFPAMSVAEPELFPAEVFTREAWMWAHLSYETRCFPKGGAASGSGLEADEDEDGVLVPLVDMLNHDHGRCQMGWASGANAAGGAWRMCVHVAVCRGDELLYSYGRKPNAKLFWYGFAQFDNPSETVPLCAVRLAALLRRTAPRRVAHTRLASLSAAFLLLDQERSWRYGPLMRRLRRQLGALLEEGGGVCVSHTEPLPAPLLALARAAHMTWRESLAVGPPSGPPLAQALCQLHCPGLSRRTERRAQAELGRVLVAQVALIVSQARGYAGSAMEQGSRQGEDPMGVLERLVEQARRGAISVGDGEYAVSAHDCQLAGAGSQLLVLMAAMESVQALC